MTVTTRPTTPGRFRRWLDSKVWSWRIGWRTVRGRLFIFRDAPDHFVMACAAVDPAKTSNPEVAARWQREAEDEMALRLRRLEQQIVEEIKKLPPLQP